MSSRIVRVKEVLRRVGFSRATLWRKVRAGEFPKGFLIGKNSVGWLESDIDGWIQTRASRTVETPSSDRPSK